ncbi:MAG TPA: FAD-binding oxidoreductase [Candidatus Methylomirabilis sp.]|nr:FAD-binding oxidoreductase [Candidatus Methylomirabilis sp.]
MQPDLGGLRGRLEAIVGGAYVGAGPAEGTRYAVDGMSPALSVQPGSQDEVAAILAACAEAGAAIIPWGGGTAMGLGNPPTRADVAVDLGRLNRIVEHDVANLNVSAEGGMRLADLQAALALQRQYLPLDPPAEMKATIGGLMATNGSGPARLLYGTARDWVLGMRIVLPDGERIRCGGKVIKNVSGYDMNKLFIGSLGTLGIITEVTFKLLPLPGVRASVIGLFPELGQAARIVAKVLDSVLLPEAMEFLNPESIRLLAPALGLEGLTGYGLAVALAGTPETVERQVRDFVAIFQEGQADRTTTLQGGQTVPAWQAIRDVFGLPSGPPTERVICKIAVPISRTAETLAAAEELARHHNLRAVVTGHAGSGIVVACYLLPKDAPPAEALADSLEEFRREVEAREGSLVLQTSPAAIKKLVDAWGKPGEAFDVMRRLKADFDPRSLCNPGRFLGGI